MSEVASSTTDEMLEHLHARLDTHFSWMRDERSLLEVAAPVFAPDQSTPSPGRRALDRQLPTR